VDIDAEYTAQDRAASNSLPRTAIDPRQLRHQHLQRLFEVRSLLEVRIAGHDEAFQSAILELVPNAGYLVLDALNPIDGNALVQTHTALTIRARCRGQDMRFETVIAERASAHRLPYYKALYPDAVMTEQRRRTSRVVVPFDRGVVVHFMLEDGRRVRGELRDLSAGGFCARLLSGDTERLQKAPHLIKRCVIELANGEQVESACEVRHRFPSRARSAPRIGVCFIDLERRHEQELARCLAELARARQRS
jgi:c-di-GMP-binding flagellar brake protein YcgR